VAVPTFARRGGSAAIALVVGLLLAELLSRGLTYVGGEAGRRLAARDPTAVLYEPFGDFGYRQRPGLAQQYFNGTRSEWNTMGYRGPVVALAKPQGTYRIVLLGESTTEGFGVGNDETIDAHMRKVLPDSYPGVCFEVVNLALGGYDSYQIYERMRADGLRLNADLVIIHSGINDVRNSQYANLTGPPDPRTLIWENVMQRIRREARNGRDLWTVVQHFSYLARVPGFLRELWQQRQTFGAIGVIEPDPSALWYFETNIVRTTELALGAGADVILSTPPSALSIKYRPSDPPEKSYWIKDAGTTEEYRLRLAARMREIAGRQYAPGQSVSYVSHRLPADEFLDDAHLTGAGNRTVAKNLARAAAPSIERRLPRIRSERRVCGAT
jgi:lysophospholipase L1-like esterase